MTLDQETSQVVKNIELYERNWHIAKVFLFGIIGIIIITVNIITYHRLLANSNANRHLLRCSVSAFNTSNPTVVHESVIKCLKGNG